MCVLLFEVLEAFVLRPAQPYRVRLQQYYEVEQHFMITTRKFEIVLLLS